jgi:hypothetical protein
MDYRINFDEPIPQMIQRLKQEHENFEISFEKIEKFVDDNEIKQATETMYGMSESIINMP